MANTPKTTEAKTLVEVRQYGAEQRERLIEEAQVPVREAEKALREASVERDRKVREAHERYDAYVAEAEAEALKASFSH